MASKQFITTGVESLARRISLAGLLSRAEAERAIARGLVSVDGAVVDASRKVADTSTVFYDGVEVPPPPAMPPLFALIKPRGVVAEYSAKKSHDDQNHYLPDLLGRWGKRSATDLGPNAPVDAVLNHYVVINKIPVMAAGLVLMTTDGLFANALNRIDSKVLTTFRIRTGSVTDSQIEEIRKWKGGIGVAGVDYGPVFIDVDKRTPTQTWLKVRLVDAPARKLGDLFWYRGGMRVNRINSYAFGPYRASDIPERQVVRLPIDEAIRHLVPQREIKPMLISIR